MVPLHFRRDLPGDAGSVLLPIARAAIDDALSGRSLRPPGKPRWLNDERATFVTLFEDGQLRGCIGSVRACRPLSADLCANAAAAALRDTRFHPLDSCELPYVHIEVSVLSPLVRIAFTDEADALSQLRSDEGVLLAWRDRQSTFLPQVWKSLPDPADFLGQLKRKAGLPAGFWAEDIEVFRYTVSKWAEKERHA